MRALLPHPGPLDEDGLITACAPDDPSAPAIRINFITSADGAVSLNGRSGALGNPHDQAMMRRLRMHADVVLVGAGTVRAENYGPMRLPDDLRRRRVAQGRTPDPRLAIVTRSLDLPDRVLHGRPLIVTRSGVPAPSGWDVLACGDAEVDLTRLPSALAERGLPQVLCEGGPYLFGSLAAAGLVDELFLTVSPILVGPGPGRIIAGTPIDALRMRTRHVLTDGELLYLRYTR